MKLQYLTVKNRLIAWSPDVLKHVIYIWLNYPWEQDGNLSTLEPGSNDIMLTLERVLRTDRYDGYYGEVFQKVLFNGKVFVVRERNLKKIRC